jgi:ADP-heptose:LPS heptosyltransferase
LFGWRRKKFRTDSILLLRLDQLGDFLLTTPLIHSLRTKYPDAKIDLLTRYATKPLAETNKDLSNIHYFDSPWFSLGGNKESWRSVWKLIKTLPKYDIVIDCHGDPRNILLAFFLGKFRVGYGCRGFGFLLDKVVPFPRKYVVERLLDLGRAIGVDKTDTKLHLPLLSSDKKVIKKPYITLSPVTVRREKEWPLENWAKVVDNLPHQVVLIGGPNDRERLEALQSMCNRKTKNIAGEVNLRQSASVIKEAKLHLGIDTVTAHIAKAVETPAVILYTHEDPKVWSHESQKVLSGTISVEKTENSIKSLLSVS